MEKKIIIKWNKDLFNIDLKNESTVKDLKNTIYEMTGINFKDQKLIKSGSILTDFESIKNYEDACTITLITSNNFSSSLIKDTMKESEPITTNTCKRDRDIEMSSRDHQIGYNYSPAESSKLNPELRFTSSISFVERVKSCGKLNLAMMTGIFCIVTLIVLLIIIKK